MPLNSAKAEGILSQQSVRRPTAKSTRRTAISPGANSDAGVLCIPLFIAAIPANNNRRKGPRRVQGRSQSPWSLAAASEILLPQYKTRKNCEDAAKGGGSRLACGKFREAERLRSEAEADRPQSPSSRPQVRNPIAAIQNNKPTSSPLGIGPPRRTMSASCTNHVTG